MLKRVLIALTIMFSVYAEPVRAIDGFVTVTSPTGGTFTEGDNMHITWDSSSNIDKINIGYKSCPSCLDWVVFTTPNTGSYDWKIDVGNTTKTEFYLQITGYETGQGSITSNSSMFNVNQKDDSPTFSSTQPTSAPTTQPQASPARYYDRTTNRFTTTPPSSPTPTPAPLTPTLTYRTLILWSEFVFEGSSTTDLKTITDPKNVADFTLDTAKGYTFIFEETLNLTDYKTLAAIQNTKNYWEFSEWFVWIEWEWWIKYEMTETIEVVYENENLTGYTPTLAAEPKSSPALIKTAQNAERKAPQILGTEAGKVKIALNDGTPVKITPNVTLDGEENVQAEARSIEIAGHTSHANLKYLIKQSGVMGMGEVNPKLDSDSGKMTFEISNLADGANNVRFYYKEGEDEWTEFGEKNITYNPSFWTLYSRQILSGSALTAAFAAGLLLPKMKKLRNLKVFRKKK